MLSSATYDAANELTQWDGTNLAYDDNGSLTADGANNYTWNARNQLTRVKDAGTGTTLANFQYDAFGRRTENAAGDGMLYDGVNAVQELSGTTPVVNRLTGGVDEFFGRTDSGGTTFPLTDALGSTIALADSSGAIQTQYGYEPFGATTPTGATSSNWYQFTGRANDGTGLYYYRARYYSPRFQRFISEDPMGFGAGDSNLYSYARESPTNFTDPGGNYPTYWRHPSGSSTTAGRKDKCYTLSCYAKNVAIGAAAGIALGLGLAPEAAPGMGMGVTESTSLSTFRFTQEGETFFHYGYADQAAGFDQGLWPGSYATSVPDLGAAEAEQGLSLSHPVDAYYPVTPPAGTPVIVNPVTAPLPNLGLPGGLPEYYFPMGTPPGSVGPPTILP